jgi:PAS domain S-box-containing protein
MTNSARSIGTVSPRQGQVGLPVRFAGLATAFSRGGGSAPEVPIEPRRRRRLPMRGYLAVIMAMATATAAAGTFYGRVEAEQHERRLAISDARRDAGRAADEIGDALATVEETVAATATTPGLDGIFASPAGCTLTFSAVGPFESGRVEIVRRDGSVACSSAPSDASGSGYADALWLDGAGRGPLSAQAADDPATGANGIVSTAPISDQGFMLAFLDMQAVGATLAKHVGQPSDHLEFLVVDRSGQTVLTRSIDRARWAGRKLGPTAIVRPDASASRDDLDGDARLYGEARVPGADWKVYAGADTAAVLAGSRATFHRQLVVNALWLLLLLVGLAVLDRKVTGPVRKLSLAMGDRRRGTPAYPVDVSGPAELGALAGNFNRLLAVVDRELVASGQLAAIVESSDDAIISTTLDGFITSWNSGAERLYGYRADEMVGQSVTPLVADDNVDDAPTLLGRVRDGGRNQHYEARRVHKDGSVIDVSVTLSPIRGEDGSVAGASASARDIGERKRVEAELRRSNAELEQFAYVASHDLSEPLRTISGYVEMLARRYGGELDDEADRFIKHTVDGCGRMRSLIDDLMSFSRSGRAEDNAGPVDTGVVVRDVLANMAATLSEADAVVVVGKLPVVHGDPVQLARLFQNLIANSVKFARADAAPRVRVDAQPRSGTCEFSVTDNGIGIDPEYKERVFKMFHRLHGRDAYPGTGMGLAICLRIVEAHGGSISIEPANDGGTVCRFTLAPGSTAGPVGPGSRAGSAAAVAQESGWR